MKKPDNMPRSHDQHNFLYGCNNCVETAIHVVKTRFPIIKCVVYLLFISGDVPRCGYNILNSLPGMLNLRLILLHLINR